MTSRESSGGPLSDDDFRNLAQLLARFVEHELDQFDHFRVEVPAWTGYIEIANRKAPDIDESLYTRIWPLPGHLQP